MKGGESFGERVLREMLENITGKETYMNEMAGMLRKAAEANGGSIMTSMAIVDSLIKQMGATSVPRGTGFSEVLNAIADELDAMQVQVAEAHNLRGKLAKAEIKAARRKNHAESLSATVTERNAKLKERGRRIGELKNEVNELRKQVPSEKERQILDMWPHFEDGELVMPGDKVHYASAYNDETSIEVESITAMDGYFVLCDDECRSNQYEQGQRVKRPVQSVLDADGVEIEAGDTVYGIGRTKHRFEVIDPHHIDPELGEAFSVRCYDRDELEECHCKPKLLTHTRPDSWERLEEDTMKGSCAYFGFADKPCSDGDGCPANKPGDCAKFKAVDIVRRAKALAGVEADA